MAILMLVALGGRLACGTESITSKLLAAIPVLGNAATQVDVWTASNDFHLSVSREVWPGVLIRGTAGTRSQFDLQARLYAPLQLAPAFLAVELAPNRVTGMMTLFFGSASLDLGRTWIEPSRWAFLQLVAHPRMTLVFGGIQKASIVVPHVGWRLFPTASAQWEIDMLFTWNEIRLSVSGVL
jgi:hypothetical protein